MLASTFIYIAGLIWNDVADRNKDARERPSRPIPSGRIPARTAFLVGLVTATMGLLCARLAGTAAFLSALVLLGLVAAYDFLVSRFPVAGSLNMGLCRGASMFMGGSVIGSWLVFPDDIRIPATLAGVTLYGASVTRISRNETSLCDFRIANWLPAIVLAVFVAACSCCREEVSLLFVLPSFAAIFVAIDAGLSIHGTCEPRHIQIAVGRLIVVLPFYQAAVCGLADPAQTVTVTILLIALALWAAATYLGKRFHAS
jgi:4-hydroxybenzoate polyprenyltransferase